jgi:hypothetical protein
VAAQGSGGGGGCLGIFALLVVVGLVIQYWYVVLGIAVLASVAAVWWQVHAQRQAAVQRREKWLELEHRFDLVLQESGRYMLDSARAAEAPLWLDPTNPEVRSFSQELKSAEAVRATVSRRRSAQANPAAVSAADLADFRRAVDSLEAVFEQTDARLREAGWDDLIGD